MIQHRSDIDGLRAVAVGLVVLFHLGLPVHGGFVGVDVFFVISGYLITSILHGDLERGRYSLLEFYQRRARRILPALLAMLLLSTLAALWLLLPSDLRGFGLSLGSTALFVSNIYFWIDTGYFAAAAEARPLLHTWSLAVEEQFYLLFPLLLAALHRHLRPGLRGLLALLTVASLLYSEWLRGQAPASAFYLLPARAWELLLGSLLALGAVPALRSRAQREALGLVGLAAILGSALFYSEKTAFPGFSALLPCLGAALLIHSGAARDSLGYRLLSLPPLVFLGLISYSLYLWHWPLIVFYQQGLLGDFGYLQKLGLLLVALALSVLSWRYVETSFRQLDRQRWPARRLLRGSAIALAVTTLIGGALLWNGLPGRFHAPVPAIAAWLDYQPKAQLRSGRCFLTSNQSSLGNYDQAACLAEDPIKPAVLLIGDSHAAHLWQGLSVEFPGVQVQQATASGCLPLLNGPGERRCTELMTDIFEHHLPAHQPAAVLLSARWRAGAVDDLVRTIRHLQQYAPRVLVLGPINEYRMPLPQLLALGLHRGQPRLPLAQIRAEPFEVDSVLERRLRAEGLPYVSAIAQTCPNQDCRLLTPGGDPLQFDYGHLSPDGARWLAGQWRESGALSF